MYLPRMTVIVESRLDCVTLAGAMVRAFCIASGASEMESGQVEVCIMEAVNNCVVHAYHSEPCHAIEVLASLQEGEFRFEVCDQGKPGNPEMLRRSRRHLLDVDPTSLQATPESGRGLAIIESIMDGMEYVSTAGKNCFSMTKRIACESPK
jgi:anti-sigma regulatory factor (Ser/Thr protein kinase)